MTKSLPDKGATGPNETTKASSAVDVAVGTGRISKMVFHRKKLTKFSSTKRPSAPARGLLHKKLAVPSLSKKRGLPTAKPVPVPVPDDINAHDVNANDNDNSDEFDDMMPSTWEHSAGGAPSDTLLAIESLGRRPETSLSIPLSGGNVITSILSSQLYPILQNDDDVTGDAAVSQEIQDLIQTGTICKLTVPPSAGSMSASSALSLSILLLTSDYLTAVQDAIERHSGISLVASWFVAHLRDWTAGSRISLRDLETSYNDNHHDDGDKSSSTHDNNSNTGSSEVSKEYTLQQVLRELQRMQVLLPCHSSDTYQLWLPEWGTVLAAWDRATTKLVQTLKRSSSMRQERSEQSLLQQDPYSPIPRSLLVHWLTVQGRVQVVQRPYGKFVQLVETTKI
jgi:hypothetical protein